MSCRAFLIEHRQKKLLVIYVYLTTAEVPEEPAKLVCIEDSEKSLIRMEFLSGKYMVFETNLKCTDVYSADEVYVEVYRLGRPFRFRSSYRIGSVWYLDYIGLA